MTEQTDLDAYLALLDRLHVGYKRKTDINLNDEPVIVIESEAQVSANVNGYPGFVMEWEFDSTGKFVTVGLWE